MDRKCAVCGVTIATGDCMHVHALDDGRVVISESAWRDITDELQRLRTLEGSLEGG